MHSIILFAAEQKVKQQEREKREGEKRGRKEREKREGEKRRREER